MAEETRGRRRKWVIAGGSVVVLLLILIIWALRPHVAQVVHPSEITAVESLTASGNVTGAQESLLAPQVSGVLGSVYVKEGQPVTAGQTVATLDDTVLRAQVQQAEAAVSTSDAQVQQATGQARQVATQIRQAQAEVNGAVKQANAQLSSAVQHLSELQAGGTAKDRAVAQTAVQQAQATVAQAEKDLQRAGTLAETDATARAPLAQAQAALRQADAGVKRAQANLTLAERNLARSQQLFDAQAIARAKLETDQAAADSAREDLQQAMAQQQQAQVEVGRQTTLLAATRDAQVQQAQTALEVARQGQRSAELHLQQISQPARPEILAQQQSAVTAARANLASAQQSGQQRIRALQETPVAAQIAVAQRQQAQAVRALGVAHAQLENAVITAPYAGVVTDILSRPGAAVGPGLPILRLVQLHHPKITADFDERDLPQLAVDQRAVMIADAFPQHPFHGYISELATRADPQRGTVQVTVLPLTIPYWLRDGLTVDVTVITQEAGRRLVIPTIAVMRTGDQASVFVVESGRVRRRAVQLGNGAQAGTIVNAGLQSTDLVVTNPQAVHEGERVSPRIARGGGGG